MSEQPEFRVVREGAEFLEDATGEFTDEANQWLLNGYEYVIERVAIELLLPGDSPRMAGQSDAHTRLLLERQGELPPILVNRRSMQVIDGTHRLAAAKLRGETSIEVVLVDIDEREAFLLAVKANTNHGLPLSRADRNAAAARIIVSHSDWSDRAIARIVGLAPGTVGAIRQRSTVEIGQMNARVGLDGRARPASATDARRRAAEILVARPGAPLREVAEEAGISLGTAHNVRSRLRKGQSPVPGNESSKERPAVPRRSCRRGSKDTTCTWSSVRHQLTKDPAIKYAGWGRAFVQWLDANASTCGEWKELVDNIPLYWADVLIDVALSCRDEWQEFALALERRQSTSA